MVPRTAGWPLSEVTFSLAPRRRYLRVNRFPWPGTSGLPGFDGDSPRWPRKFDRPGLGRVRLFNIGIRPPGTRYSVFQARLRSALTARGAAPRVPAPPCRPARNEIRGRGSPTSARLHSSQQCNQDEYSAPRPRGGGPRGHGTWLSGRGRFLDAALSRGKVAARGPSSNPVCEEPEAGIQVVADEGRPGSGPQAHRIEYGPGFGPVALDVIGR